MSINPKVLTIGDTSGIYLIAYQLSQLQEHIDIFCCSSHLAPLNTWSPGSTSNLKEFSIHKPVFRSLEDIGLYFPKSRQFDLVFISFRSFPHFRASLNSIKPFIDTKTVIVVDASLGLSLEGVVHECLPHYVVLCFLADADIKSVSYGIFHSTKKSFKVLYGHSGLPNTQQYNVDVKEYSDLAYSYLSAKDTLVQRISQLIQKTDGDTEFETTIPKPKLMFHIWLNTILVIAGEILPLAFDELNLQNIVSDIALRPIFKGLIIEILSISLNFGIGDFKDFLILQLGAYNIDILVKEMLRRYPHDSHLSSAMYPPFLNASKLQFDFLKGYENHTFIIIFQAILISDEIGMENPYLTFLYGVLMRLANRNRTPIWFYREKPHSRSPNMNYTNKEILFSSPSLRNSEERLDRQNDPNVGVKDDDKDEEGNSIDENLAELYVDALQIPAFEDRDDTAIHAQVQELPGDYLEKSEDTNKCQEDFTKLTVKSYQYEVEERKYLNFDFGDGFLDKPASSTSSQTEDGIETIANKVALEEFEILEAPMQGETHSGTHRLMPYNDSFSGSAYTLRKKTSNLLNMKRRYKPLKAQRTEGLTHEEYSSKHGRVFNSLGGNHEEKNRDRYGYLASPLKPSKQ